MFLQVQVQERLCVAFEGSPTARVGSGKIGSVLVLRNSIVEAGDCSWNSKLDQPSAVLFDPAKMRDGRH